MEVILMERIDRLGELGDGVRVKDGFARNHLLPQRKAVRATKEAKERFELDRATLEEENASRRESATVDANKMRGIEVIIVQQAGDSGQLYGAVRARDVASALVDAGFIVSRKLVVLKTVIKALGIYSVDVWLHAEEKVEVSVNVARSEEEARLQASGVNVRREDVLQEEEERPEVETLFEQPPADPELEADAVSDDVSGAENQAEE